VEIAAGVIDQDYRGNIGVVLFNFSQQDFKGVLHFAVHFYGQKSNYSPEAKHSFG